jgi:2'-5' RNA ligase
MEGVRSFIAIEIPPSLQHLLEGLQKDLKQADGDVRWVRPDGIHLTLKFLGSIQKKEVERISRALESIAASWEPFELNFNGLGCFPGLRAPRVLWVGVNRGGEHVTTLQQAIEERLAEKGFAREARSFTPHVTIGRVRSPRRKEALIKAIEMNRDVAIGAFWAQEITFFQSELRPTGAIYSKIGVFPMPRKNR